ncbi:uncharacterized protein [Maniola hyperantus]|uniref:uncharacterized protein n=1 Tax=Aphantopus hyperantus TaxID=2795564 RepID=UPI0021346892
MNRNSQTILFLLLASLLLAKCEHLILGDADKKQLIYHTKAEYAAVPFIKRVKEVFFSSPDQRIISAIMAYDNLHTSATATVTAGGIGYSYVNLKLKSQRGEGLEYDIGIYS